MKIVQILGMTGYDDCGKDSYAKYLVKINKYQKFKIMSLADPLKEIVAETLEVSVEEIEELKKAEDVKPVSYRGDKMSMRDYIINTATALRKHIHRDVFLKKIEDKIVNEIRNMEDGESLTVIIPDLRFKREYEYLKDMVDEWNKENKEVGHITFNVIRFHSDLENCGKNGKKYNVAKIPYGLKVDLINGEYKVNNP